jgi:cell division protein FtsL
MRDVFLWGAAVLFLLAAMHTVSVRRSVYADAYRIGVLEERVREARRRNENLVLLREELASPADVLRRAEAAGYLATAEGTR